MELTTRAALGTSASLGALYDARRDDFCSLSIFKKTIPEAAVSWRDTPFSDVTLLHSDDYSSKFSKLDVNADLQVSVLGGLFRLEGSGQYLNDQKKSARAVKSSLVYNIKTKEESLNIHHEALKDSFAIDAIQTGVGTHVVVGISWGANSILTCQYENKENASTTDINGELSAKLNRLALSISGKGGVEHQEGDTSTGLKLDVRIFGDIVAANDELPTTPEAAIELMKRMPRLVSTANNGKGKPLSYRLLSIDILKSYLKFTLQTDYIFKSLEEASLKRVVIFFDQVTSAKQKMYDFLQDVSDFQYCIPSEDLQKVLELKGKIDIEESKLRSELATILTEVRSGNGGVEKIEALLTKFQQNDMSPQKVDLVLRTWTLSRNKIEFARLLAQNGVKYVGIGVLLDDIMMDADGKKTYVLYFSQSSETDDPERWQGNKQLFFTTAKKKQDQHSFIAVDCDIHPTKMKSGKTSLLEVVNNKNGGHVEIEDLLEEEKYLKSNPMVKATTRPVKILHKPNKRVPLSIACTGESCDPSINYEWICRKCKKPTEYGFDQFMYCSCGKYPTADLEFRCPDSKHGINFQRHDTGHLSKLLDALRSFKEMNILLLGETGVGKSTWINSFANYMNSESLDEATKVDVVSVIPTKFTVMNDNYEEVLVRAGEENKDEVHVAGRSATQSSKVYPFTVGDTIVRLIDTPGIGDTRGIEMDKKNFVNILGTLSYHDEIHGICILLKPNDSRLTVTFKFCIKELLVNLHKEASQNIVFCFTNSRGTFYKPGDTLPTLRKLLSEDKNINIPLSKQTIYCFDSESFRFLAAIKNKPPVLYSQESIQDFSFSWQTSRNETKRMLDHFKTLPPHKVKNMKNLHFSRKLILKLTRPLAEIIKTNEENKIKINQEIATIKQMDDKIELLKGQRMMKRKDIKNTRIAFPKTVCTHSDCVDMYSLSGAGQKAAFYKKLCHAHCYLTDVDEDVVGHAALVGCAAMDSSGNCTNCSHRYTVHAHFWYDSAVVEVEVEDRTVVASLKEKRNATEMKRKMIQSREKEVFEYEAERKEIERASIRFAYFLKANSITLTNDAMEEYLEHQIREERDKLSKDRGRDPVLLNSLDLSLVSYRQERLILEGAMNQGSFGERPPTQADVEELITRLKNLKRSGKPLEEALNAIHDVEKVVYHEVRLPLKPRKLGFFGWTIN